MASVNIGKLLMTLGAIIRLDNRFWGEFSVTLNFICNVIKGRCFAFSAWDEYTHKIVAFTKRRWNFREKREYAAAADAECIIEERLLTLLMTFLVRTVPF